MTCEVLTSFGRSCGPGVVPGGGGWPQRRCSVGVPCVAEPFLNDGPVSIKMTFHWLGM